MHFFRISSIGLLAVSACSPLQDLDATGRGSTSRVSAGGDDSGGAMAGRPASGGEGGTLSSANGGTAAGAATGGAGLASGGAYAGSAPVQAGETAAASGGSVAEAGHGGSAAECCSGGTTSGGAPLISGGSAGVVGSVPATGGVSMTGGASTGGAAAGAPQLPDDLPNSPVRGEIVFSSDATWMVDDVAQPTFEIHTPTASYWLVKSTASIVSIMDASANDRRQWIDYSSSFRPLRGVPGLGALPKMTTVFDRDSQTPTHLRLECRSEPADWQWVWDFYVTHVTLTVNRTPRAFAFSYRGVPGGTLDAADQLVLSSGVAQGARNSYSGDLPGPFEWAYLVDTTLGRSLFMIEHGDDDLAERYQVKDNDSALLSFGDGALVRVPQRFSLGLIGSGVHATVQQRVSFVIDAIR